MKGWLLDTNIISELRKPNCHPAVKQWADRQPPQSFYLSAITFAEIRFGIDQVNDSVFREELLQWLEETLRPWFSDRSLAVDEDVILIWRQMVEKGRKQGYTYSQPDLFLAATAVHHNLCVATRNVADFQRSGVSVFNPFTDSQSRKLIAESIPLTEIEIRKLERSGNQSRSEKRHRFLSLC